MCTYSILAEQPTGNVRWCHDCAIYTLTFNNLVLSFGERAFYEFKENVAACYAENATAVCQRSCRDIFFNTRLEGLQMVFSTNEMADLLTMLQEAELCHAMLDDESKN